MCMYTCTCSVTLKTVHILCKCILYFTMFVELLVRVCCPCVIVVHRRAKRGSGGGFAVCRSIV